MYFWIAIVWMFRPTVFVFFFIMFIDSFSNIKQKPVS